MKKALLLFAMFAFIGTAYTASASDTNVAGIYCENGPGDGHKCDKDCKKDCKKAKSCAKGSKSAKSKGSCCSKGGAAAKSCGGKTGSKASASTDAKTKEQKK